MNELYFENGDSFPLLGLGTWQSKPNEVYEAVLEAIKVGYRHFDCAYIYANETEIGQAFNFAFTNGMVKREDVFITSKLWNSDHEPERVEIALIKSLKDLQLDYLDLYLIHWPIAFKAGYEQAKKVDELVSLELLPIVKTWGAMEVCKEKGLAKHIGVSNFNIAKLKNLIEKSKIKPEVNQIEIHPYFQQHNLVEFCTQNKILLTAYSPLGSRHLINSVDAITRHEIVISIAAKHNCTEAQVLLAWGMKRGIAVIPKSVHPMRLKENIGALNVYLDTDDMAEISKLDKNLRLAKGAFAVIEGGPYSQRSIWED